MQVVRGLECVEPLAGGSVLTVGNFDGVHRAHRALLERARQLGDEAGLPVVLLTFDPHPLTVVAPQKVPPRLMLLEDRLRCFEQDGVDLAVVARSEPGLMGLEAETFVARIVVGLFRPRHVVEGPSFGFGRGRKGNAALLARFADRSGYRLHLVEAVTVDVTDGDPALVSSSLVRRLLQEGRVEKACECLTRPYAITSTVAAGYGLGRRIGVPTANLAPCELLMPGDGVYAGWAWTGGQRFACAINVGPAPTFEVGERRVEAHLLDFNGDLYGRGMRVEFVRRLRGQTKFVSAAALADQLQRDIQAVRAALLQEPTVAAGGQATGS